MVKRRMKIDKPDFSLKDIFPESINHYSPHSSMKAKMEKIYHLLLEDEEDYIKKLPQLELHTSPSNKETLLRYDDEINKNDLMNLYTRKLLNSDYSIRKYYDKIVTSSTICPFCGKRHTTTVDHFLPKANYSNFSITPINLVPCCADCNKEKSDGVIASKEELYFHPYEEDISAFKWLDASITIENNKILVNYFVTDKHIDGITYSRMKRQFDNLKLKEYYSIEGSLEFNRAKEFYSNLYKNKGGKLNLQNHFEMEREKAKYKEHGINSIEYVLYDTLINYIDDVITIL